MRHIEVAMALKSDCAYVHDVRECGCHAAEGARAIEALLAQQKADDEHAQKIAYVLKVFVDGNARLKEHIEAIETERNKVVGLLINLTGAMNLVRIPDELVADAEEAIARFRGKP